MDDPERGEGIMERLDESVLLCVNDLCFSYGTHEILKNITFSASKGEYVYILGPNGVGKSTLFRSLMGHLKPSRGKVKIQGKGITSYKPSELAKKIAYIPQTCHPSFNYSVLQLAMMGRTAYLSPFASPKTADYERTYEILEKLGLEEKAECGIREISGGERQLAMIARALVQEADILLMDEPTSSLDYGNGLRIQMQMKNLASSGLLVIQSSHNPEHAMFFADQVIALKEGHIEAKGKTSEVLTEKLLKKLYGLDVEVRDSVIIPKLDI